MTLKYQVEIDHFVSQGAELPALHVITDKESFRYVFANSAQQNHIPPHKNISLRRLRGKITNMMHKFNDIQIIIMAGGVGSRFWPMSTPDYPKQFIDVMGVGRSLIQLTVDRLKPICPVENMCEVKIAI